MKNLLKGGIALLLVVGLNAHAFSGTLETANVMAPLNMLTESEWNAFDDQLGKAKEMGINAVTVDVWWGKVAAKKKIKDWDWKYYDRIFKMITDHKLDIIPIMSFHQCGGNVGDEKTGCKDPIRIPGWVWDSVPGVSRQDLQYKSEQDKYSEEVVSLWADELVGHHYQTFVEEFTKEYKHYASDIDEFNVSLGTAGELRYPSYNLHDGDNVKYPKRGYFQAYSQMARDDFREWALERHGNLNGVNAHWGFGLQSVDQIGPPDDEDPTNGRAEWFVNNHEHWDTNYGKDFVEWYHTSLMEHGEYVLGLIDETLDNAEGFEQTPLGLKMAGVHWQMSSGSNYPRIAEITAGLISTHVNSNDPSTGHGYDSVMAMVNRSRAANKTNRHHIFHFTCLEKANKEWENLGKDGWKEVNSLASALVFWVGDAAADAGIEIKGENALDGGVTTLGGPYADGWYQINNAFTYSSYNGLTVLRIDKVVYEGSVGRNEYVKLMTNHDHPGNEN